MAAECTVPDGEVGFWLVAEFDVAVAVPVFFATGWMVVGWVEAAGCGTGLRVLAAVELSWAYKVLAARQNPVSRTSMSLRVL